MTGHPLKSALATVLALASLGSVPAQAADNRVQLQRTSPNVQMAPSAIGTVARAKLQFDCVVAGTPVEFPNDIFISNPYNFTVAAGTQASYNAPFGNTGTVLLPALAPGAGFWVSNAVPGGVTAGAACSAKQI
jgi:hypothetical protein